jgi:hypothetical protein
MSRRKIARRIYEDTPQEVKDYVRQQANELVNAPKVLVEIWNPDLNSSEWLPGFIKSTRSSGDANEDFERITVQMYDGRVFEGCHPDCVKEIEQKGMQLKLI